LRINQISCGFIQVYSGLEKKSSLQNLARLYFLDSLFSKKQACGPDARALRGKSIGGKGNSSEDPAAFPQKEAGRSGARQGAPTTG
jgi:hypothetical protein